MRGFLRLGVKQKAIFLRGYIRTFVLKPADASTYNKIADGSAQRGNRIARQTILKAKSSPIGLAQNPQL
jgi:hypothetical protein